MAQINLLKQKSDTTKQWNTVAKVFARLLVVLLVMLAGYYAWLFIQTKAADNKILSLEQNIEQVKNQSLNNQDRAELLTRQQQLQALDKLINSHEYWSGLMPALANVTLKNAAYTSLKATADGSLELSVTMPSLADLDKFLQVFDLPQVNANFSNVSIGAFHEIPQGNTTVVAVDVKMSFNPQLLQYQNLMKASGNTSPVNNAPMQTASSSSVR